MKNRKARSSIVKETKFENGLFREFVKLENELFRVEMMEEDEFLGCISCMSTTDLYDLFAVYEENGEAYANMFETCFDIKIPPNVKYLCSDCAEQLEKAVAFKEQTSKSVAMLKEALSQDEEYLDEKILEEEEKITQEDPKEDCNDSSKKESDQEYDENEEDVEDAPYSAPAMQECHICGLSVDHLEQHLDRCHSSKAEADNRKYPCHFCENVYISKKACFTHLRMKHGLKLCPEQAAKLTVRERKKCHMCSRDFSQKQILNKHLWKAHGIEVVSSFEESTSPEDALWKGETRVEEEILPGGEKQIREVEKRKAFICPLCSERVSYGANFSAHLLHAHRLRETVQRLQFHNMDDFLLFKSAIQEETKYRFRKTTASKQTIEGVRSHYMCSQSGVYVYQGKGKRPAPERQIYKTGKACPAHMIVTETMDNVLVTFYKTHVGHGPCPYFEPREPKKPKMEQPSTSYILPEDIDDTLEGSTVEEGAVCDVCGLVCADTARLRAHRADHKHSIPCQYCHHDFEDLDAWTHHITVDHNMAIY